MNDLQVSDLVLKALNDYIFKERMHDLSVVRSDDYTKLVFRVDSKNPQEFEIQIKGPKTFY